MVIVFLDETEGELVVDQEVVVTGSSEWIAKVTVF